MAQVRIAECGGCGKREELGCMEPKPGGWIDLTLEWVVYLKASMGEDGGYSNIRQEDFVCSPGCARRWLDKVCPL